MPRTFIASTLATPSSLTKLIATRPLWLTAAVLCCAAALCAVLLWVDDRMLAYDRVWTKPMKFQLALAVQTATLAWALGSLPERAQLRAMPRWLVLL